VQYPISLKMEFNITFEYPFDVNNHRINGKDVAVIGVEHVRPFFQRYQHFFEFVINAYDALVFEQPINGPFWYSDFFGDLGDIACREMKTVYQSDSVTYDSTSMDYMTGFTGALVTGMGMSKGLRGAYSGMDRRGFLKMLGMLGVGSSLMLGSMPGIQMRMDFDMESAMDYGPDDFLFYGDADHRNIMIAEGIDKICNEVDDIKSIAAIHGAFHTSGIDTYLSHPKLRAKKLAYLPYNLLSLTKVREYEPNPDAKHLENQWKLKRVF